MQFGRIWIPWWRHQMEIFSELLVICAGNSPVTGELPAQRPVTRIFYVFFDLCLDKRLSKQTGGWWFETPSRPSWRHCNDMNLGVTYCIRSGYLCCEIAEHWSIVHCYLQNIFQTAAMWYVTCSVDIAPQYSCYGVVFLLIASCKRADNIVFVKLYVWVYAPM